MEGPQVGDPQRSTPRGAGRVGPATPPPSPTGPHPPEASRPRDSQVSTTSRRPRGSGQRSGFAPVIKASLLVRAGAPLAAREPACRPDASLSPPPHGQRHGRQAPWTLGPALPYVSDPPASLRLGGNRLGRLGRNRCPLLRLPQWLRSA